MEMHIPFSTYLMYFGQLSSEMVGSVTYEWSVMVGWVYTLAEWLRSESLPVSLIAAKTLANMDVDRNRLRQPYADSVFVYHPVFRGDGYDSAVFPLLIDDVYLQCNCMCVVSVKSAVT